MENEAKKLSDYIDRLNAEQKPEAHEDPTDSAALQELFETVRKVRSLRDPAMPGADYQRKLTQSLANRLTRQKPAKTKKRFWLASAASIALILFISLLTNYLSLGNGNIVHAMEEAYQKVKAYHGVLNVIETNADGVSTTQAKLEIWSNQEGQYYVKGLEGQLKDIVTVNNGEQKWQIQPAQKQVQRFPAFPDRYRFSFELGNEIKEAAGALSSKVVGEELLAGRKATILEVTPQGGEAYRIWVDKETKLPLQKQSAMHNAIQYTLTYSEFDLSDEVPGNLMTYQVPEGFAEVNTNPEQVVTDLKEASEAAGFTPTPLETVPAGFGQDRIAVIPNKELIKVYYSGPDQTQVVIIQGKSNSEFEPVRNANLGKIDGNPVEIQSPVMEDTGVLTGAGLYAGVTDMSSIRFQKDGFEYALVGNAALAQITSFAENLTKSTIELPTPEAPESNAPQVEVPVDLEIEGSEQKSADSGSSPWKLDPAFVAQVFVSLKISPEGITGDYPIKEDELTVIENNGEEAIVQVSGALTPIEKVYLKRLIRKDATGIWTVVGYNPVAEE